MSSVVLSGDTSGTVTLTVPAVAGTNTVTVPAGTGTMAVQGVSTNIVSGTAVASTSGTSIDFTSIPSWVKRITVMLSGMSTNGSSIPIVQLGSGSVQTTGYVAGATNNSSSGTIATFTTGFGQNGAGAASYIYQGHCVLTLMNGTTWVSSHNNHNGNGQTSNGGGNVTLSGTLDRVRITTVNGTDTFDAGSINILYE